MSMIAIRLISPENYEFNKRKKQVTCLLLQIKKKNYRAQAIKITPLKIYYTLRTYSPKNIFQDNLNDACPGLSDK